MSRDIAKNLTLVLGSFIVALFFAEIILRVFLAIPYSMEVEYVPDGCLGFRLAPDRVYMLKSGGRCSVNNLGFRGAALTDPRNTAHRARIIAVGESSTFSYETDDEEIWTRVLEKKLRQRYGENIEVINAGVPGYSIFESKINYMYQLRALHPDVVIAYDTWNDIKWFRAVETGAYPKKGVSGKDLLTSILRHLQIAWRIRNYIDQVWTPRQRENRYGHFGGTGAAISPDGAAHEWERQNYDDLVLLLNNDKVIPVLSTQGGLLSSDNIEDPEVRAVVYTEYVNLSFEELLAQWNAVSRIIERAAKKGGALFIDVYSQVPHNRLMFLDHVHLTDAGNARVAQILFEGLIREPRIDSLMRSRNATSATGTIR
jgi:lysophospholipase L1-like esterase